MVTEQKHRKVFKIEKLYNQLDTCASRQSGFCVFYIKLFSCLYKELIIMH